MASRTHDPEPLLTPAEVASMFRVDPKTVTRWAKAGKLSAIRTLGGHRRYRESEVRALLQGQIPSQRLLFCSSLEGKASIVRQLEPQLHIDGHSRTVWRFSMSACQYTQCHCCIPRPDTAIWWWHTSIACVSPARKGR